MPQTVLITGSSSGIGEATALLFHQRGWNVIATMRNPGERKTRLHEIDAIEKIHLDVLDTASMDAALEQALAKFSRIDVLVNNAGYGLVGPFEASTPVQIRRQFDTNLFGLMELTRRILPHFRENQHGTLINVASIGGRLTFPLYSLYHGTKWALEGFSESLQHELRPFGIRVKIIEPGPIKTDFYDRSMEIMRNDELTIYDEFVTRRMKNMTRSVTLGLQPRAVAKTIVRAASMRSRKLRYPVGSMGMLLMRRLLPDRLFNGIVRLAT